MRSRLAKAFSNFLVKSMSPRENELSYGCSRMNSRILEAGLPENLPLTIGPRSCGLLVLLSGGLVVSWSLSLLLAPCSVLFLPLS